MTLVLFFEVLNFNFVVAQDDDDNFLKGSLDRVDRIKNRELTLIQPTQFNIEIKKSDTADINSSGFATVLPGKRDVGVAVYTKLQEFKCFIFMFIFCYISH